MTTTTAPASTGPTSAGQSGTAAIPSLLPVFEHRMVSYRRVWRGSVYSTFLLPVLFLISIGVSVGTYVNRTGELGVPYLDYIAPGVLASTAFQVAIGECTWPVMSAFIWVRTYHAMRASPLRPQDLVGGETLFVLFRVVLSGGAFLLAMLVFGVVHSWWALTVLPTCLLLGAAVIGPMLAFSASITSDNMFALLFRFVVIPMTLFAGVFFPVSLMPPAARWLAYASPLWHGVELCRAATLGPSVVPMVTSPWVHISYLALWAIMGYEVARLRYANRLTD